MAWACGPSDRSGCGKTLRHGSVAGGVGARERGELDLIARRPGSATPVYARSKRTALAHDRVEHRLDVRLRAADDAQDVAGGGLRVQRRGELAVARLQLGESRTFSIAITAWSAKVWRSAICASVNGRRLAAGHR